MRDGPHLCWFGLEQVDRTSSSSAEGFAFQPYVQAECGLLEVGISSVSAFACLRMELLPNRRLLAFLLADCR